MHLNYNLKRKFYIEGITRRREDMDYIFEWENIVFLVSLIITSTFSNTKSVRQHNYFDYFFNGLKKCLLAMLILMKYVDYLRVSSPTRSRKYFR